MSCVNTERGALWVESAYPTVSEPVAMVTARVIPVNLQRKNYAKTEQYALNKWQASSENESSELRDTLEA